MVEPWGNTLKLLNLILVCKEANLDQDLGLRLQDARVEEPKRKLELTKSVTKFTSKML